MAPLHVDTLTIPRDNLVPYLRAHCPALTAPLPWMRRRSLSGLVVASSLMKKKDLGSSSLASTYINGFEPLNKDSHFDHYREAVLFSEGCSTVVGYRSHISDLGFRVFIPRGGGGRISLPST